MQVASGFDASLTSAVVLNDEKGTSRNGGVLFVWSVDPPWLVCKLIAAAASRCQPCPRQARLPARPRSPPPWPATPQRAPLARFDGWPGHWAAKRRQAAGCGAIKSDLKLSNELACCRRLQDARDQARGRRTPSWAKIDRGRHKGGPKACVAKPMCRPSSRPKFCA
jgi:hypothetical protein